MFFQKQDPIPQLILNRIFIGIIVLLALTAGYFFNENQRLAKLCSPDQEIQPLFKGR